MNRIINLPDSRGYLLWRRVGIGEAYSDFLMVLADLGGVIRVSFEVHWDAVTFKPVQIIVHRGTKRMEGVLEGASTFALAGGRADVPEPTW